MAGFIVRSTKTFNCKVMGKQGHFIHFLLTVVIWGILLSRQQVSGCNPAKLSTTAGKAASLWMFVDVTAAGRGVARAITAGKKVKTISKLLNVPKRGFSSVESRSFGLKPVKGFGSKPVERPSFSSTKVKLFPQFTSRFGKPPHIAYNKAQSNPDFEKLKIIDGNNIDNLARYKDQAYIEYLSSAKEFGNYVPNVMIVHASMMSYRAIIWNEWKSEIPRDDVDMEWRFEMFNVSTSSNYKYANLDEFPQIRTSLGNVTYRVKSSELKTCFRWLKISKSHESVLVYICYQWTTGPHIFMWTLLSLLGGFYLLLPPLVAIFYIRSFQDRSHTYLEAAGSDQQYLETGDRRMTGRPLLCYGVFAIISIGILIGIVFYFFNTNYDLTKEDTHSVLFTNRLIRIGISLASLVAIIFLSLVNTAVNIWKFPCMHLVFDEEDVKGEAIKIGDFCNCILCCSPCLIIEVALNLFRCVLKLFFYLLFGITLYLAEAIANMYIWTQSDEYDPAELLNYAFLSDKEKIQWISKVNQYVLLVTKALQSRRFVQFIVDNEKPKQNSFDPHPNALYKFKYSIIQIFKYSNSNIEAELYKESPKISFLHTGSIPEQFGKPLMIFGDLDRTVSNSFPELRSDHDVMFVLEHLPVYEKGQVMDKSGFWLEAESIGQDGKEEFVKIIPMMDSSKLVPLLKNTIASNYLTEVVSSIFFKGGKITNEGRELPLEMNTTELGSNLTSSLLEDISYNVLLTRAGPSVNMKVTGHRSQIVFDCDFLLSLPVAGWPSPAKEWKMRRRTWPSQDTVDWLVSLPCHLIAKPVTEGDEETWRFSFSRQEIEIANILPSKARLCYVGLKFIFKKHLKSIFSGLKSYHMLTLFFWFMEEEQTDIIWGKEDSCNKSFKSIFLSLMKFVSKALSEGNIPHYFIRSINLVSIMKKDRKDTKTIADVSKHIMKMVANQNFLEKFLYDRTAFHALVLNRAVHEEVLQDRQKAESYV
eukprot:GFUD01078426.1.p1 GENE.GFUD01078426.1~~GFUD01078426.1.p1  ORF type:complete len:982 (-),score=180.67 GFUD01078426.1:82-3027(-)